jgi:ubiquitin-protein ligase
MASGVASKRLFSEYRSLLTSPPDGITAGPVNEDDLFAWEALIQGPEGTPFEGGIFPAELKFPKDYPLNPPKMKFLGEIWHPNGMCLRISAPGLSLQSWRGSGAMLTYDWAQYTPTAKCASRSYTHRAMIRITMSRRRSGGHRFKVLRRSS